MHVVSTAHEVRDAVAALKRGPGTLGFVPTMGALHEGHLSLVRASREADDHTAVSIFVNPLQFGENEDLDRYPRDLEGDTARLAAAGVSLVFTPTPEILYGPGFCTYVEVEAMTEGLCGRHRPGHFRGVTTVVAKLFNLVQPHRAYFGLKDFQQAMVLRRMAGDLDMAVEVVVRPTVRESDGLAMSSRNLGLSPEGRGRALTLSRGLTAAREAFEAGERDGDRLLDAARRVLDAAAGVEVQYVELVAADTLKPLVRVEESAVLAVAAFVEGIRLIDNVVLGA